MSQQYRYPSSASLSIASQGETGQAVPLFALQVAGENASGDLQALQLDSSGNLLVSIGAGIANPLPVTDAAAEASLSAINAKLPGTLGQKAMAASLAVVMASDQSALHVIVDSSALPSGASTAAKQDTGNTSLASIDTKTPALGQAAMTASSPVVIASNQSSIPVTVASLPLPTGAATETTLAAMSAKLPGTLGQKAMTASLAVVLASDQSSIPVVATQSGTWNITNISGTISLPTGASTSALQTTGNTSLSSIDGKFGSLGQKTMSGSAPVVIASDQSALPVAASNGMAKANTPNYKDYTGGSVTTSAYVQLIASTTSAAKLVSIFDSSGQAMIIAVGAAASEVDQIYVPPGGGDFPLAIPAGSRVAIKALTATAASGYNLLNLLG